MPTERSSYVKNQSEHLDVSKLLVSSNGVSVYSQSHQYTLTDTGEGAQRVVGLSFQNETPLEQRNISF